MARRSRFHRSRVVTAIFTAMVAFAVLLMFVPGINSMQGERDPAVIDVHRGDGFRQIVDELHETGLIRFRWPLLAAGAVVPDLHKIKPGRYRVPRDLSTIGLLYYLHSRPQDEVRLMIPNGIEQRKIAGVVASGLDIDSTAFMNASRDPKLLQSLGIEAHSTEGYLFPGTYNFPWASSPQEVITFLVNRFRAFYTYRLKEQAAKAGLDETRMLTLASIVEAETPLDEEKPIIASVYLNRLKKNMRLQADPTVQYAIPGDGRQLSYKDLEVSSPYNTYRHAGLPPGPICNPGAASIEAVLNPAKTDYLYFVATGHGGHSFASTLAGHSLNVRRYRLARAEQQKSLAPGRAE